MTFISSQNPLNYTINSSDPIRRYKRDRDPDEGDFRNFNLGDEWLNSETFQWFKLCDKTATTATWRLIAGPAGSAEEFIVDSGTSPVVPNSTNQITLTGANGLRAVGSTNTITITSPAINTITGDTGGALSASSNNFNILGTSGQINVAGSGSTLTLSLAGGGTAIDSITPGSGTSPVVPDSNGNISFPNGNGIATVGSLNTLTVNMASPFTGDFSFRSTTSGDTEILTVTNTSNTASSSANQVISVAGTSGGDPWTQWTRGSTDSWSWGTSQSDGEFKLNYNNSASVSPSTGTNYYSVNASTNRVLEKFQITAQEFSADAAVVKGITNTFAGGDADACMIVESTTGGKDAFVAYAVVTQPATSVYTYSQGIDQTDSGAWKLSFVAGANPGPGVLRPSQGTNFLKFTTSGQMTLPQQPKFFAIKTTDALDVTGDGTAYTVASYDSTRFNVGSGFNTTSGLYTCPIAGQYHFGAAVTLSELGAGHTTGNIQINGSSYGSQLIQAYNPANARQNNNTIKFNADLYIDCAAGETVSVVVSVNDSTKTVDVDESIFWGYLVN